MVKIAGDAVAATTVLVLSDYGKGVLDGETSKRLIDAAHAAGRPVVVDPKGRDYGRYAGADLITAKARWCAVSGSSRRSTVLNSAG